MRSLAAGLVARLVTRYARFCLRTSRFEIPPETDAILARTWDDGTPTTYVYWHDEFVLNVLLPLHWRDVRVRPEMPACGANDAFGGEMIRAVLEPLGVPLAILPRRSDRDAKLRVLAGALRKDRHLLLAADYGKPWFHARPTAFQLARETGGRVVAMHVSATREVQLKRGAWRLRLPRPYGSYALRLGEIAYDLGEDDAVLATKLTAALEALRGGTTRASDPFTSEAKARRVA